MSRLIRATGLVMAFTVLSRLLGMLRDSIINYHLGIGLNADAYTAAFKVPDLLMMLVAGGALSSTLIPAITEYLHRNDERAAWKTFSVVSTVTFLVATAFIVVCEVWAPVFVHLLNPWYNANQIALTVPLVRIILPAQIFFLIGGLLNGVQNARGQFLLPALAPSIYNLGIIVGAIFLFPRMGPSGMMWGGLFGALIGNFSIQLVSVQKLGLQFRPSLDVSFPGAMKVWKLLVPILLGISFTNIDQIINGSFASSLHATGAQNVLQYANRLELIPIGIFAQALGIAILPSLSQLVSAGKTDELRAAINRGLRMILFVTIPASVLMSLLAVPIIATLSHHGKFGSTATFWAAGALQAFCIGIFAWSTHAVLTRSFYALHDSRTPVVTGTIMTAVFIAMEWFVVHYTKWGVKGLAGATSLAAIIYMATLYIILHRRLRGLLGFRLMASTVKTVLATIVMGIALYLTRTGCYAVIGTATTGTLHALFTTGIASAAGIVSFVFVAQRLQMTELDGLKDLLSKVVGRRHAHPKL